MSRVIGSPYRYIIDSSLQENVFPAAIGDLIYAEIVARADFLLAPPDTLSTLTIGGSDLDARVVNGACDHSYQWNWGEQQERDGDPDKVAEIIKNELEEKS